MDCQIWLRSDPDRGYVATVLGWPSCEGIGRTEQEALQGARVALERALTQGKLVTMHLEPALLPEGAENPWADDAGIWQDDPQWEEFQTAVADFRREIEAAETPGG